MKRLDYSYKSFVKDCTNCDSIKFILEKYELDNMKELYSHIRRAKVSFAAGANQCLMLYEKFKEMLDNEKENLAKSVEDEVLAYLHNGSKMHRLRTNTELAVELGNKVYRDKPVSKKYISNILIKYLPKDLRLFRHDELKDQSKFFIYFKSIEENKANGKKGADKTNKMRRDKKNSLIDKL